jgi:hypothetical protein
MKLVVADTLFEPLQLFRTNTGTIANTASTQRDFIPMLILRTKVSNREGQFQSFKVDCLRRMVKWISPNLRPKTV